MTVSTTAYAVTLSGNGATTVFSFPFIADNASTIQVTYTDANGVQTVLNPNSYTLFINTPPVGGLWGIGGTVTYPLSGSPIASGTRLTIERIVPYTQGISIANQGAFYPSVVEQGLDLLELEIQQVAGQMTNTVRAPVVDGTLDMVLPAAVARANKFLIFDINGQPTTSAGVPSTTPIGATSKLFFLSNYATIALADAAAAAASGVLIIDTNVTLPGNTTLSAKVVQFEGGVITRGSNNLTISGSVLAGDVTIFDKAGSGTVSIAKGAVNVAWFAPTADGATDDSVPFNKAFAAGSKLTVRVPSGSYKCNATLPNEVLVQGDGSEKTFILPFNTAVAAWTYTYRSGSNNTFWAYNSLIQGVCFQGVAQVGVGFTMAQTVPANYTAGDENVSNISFEHCAFLGLNKGFQAPFGNIRKQFTDCGWQNCYYGVYSINAKFGGLMHAGNLYITRGEFNSCVCALYLDNAVDGYYPPVITNTIFENCSCAGRFGNSGGIQVGPVLLTGLSTEVNGTVVTANVTLDIWTGTVLTTETISSPIWYFVGSKSHGTFNGGGIIAGIRLKADNSTVEIANSARSEGSTSFGGQGSTVDDITTSQIVFTSVVCDDGPSQGSPGTIVRGTIQQSRNNINSSGSGATGRSLIIPDRSVISPHGGGLLGTAVTFNTQQNYTIGAAITGTVVADGNLYANVNEYTANVAASTRLVACNTTLASGYWVYTLQCKTVSGVGPAFQFWDQSTNLFADFRIPYPGGQWYTIGGIGSISGSPTLFLETYNTGGGSSTWRLGPFQCRGPFSSYAQAQVFLSSLIYAS